MNDSLSRRFWRNPAEGHMATSSLRARLSLQRIDTLSLLAVARPGMTVRVDRRDHALAAKIFFAAPLEPLDFIPIWALTGEALGRNAEELRRSGVRAEGADGNCTENGPRKERFCFSISSR